MSRLGGYVKMSIAERREAVAELTAGGQSTREIAEVLGTSNATVARDLEAVTNVTETPSATAEEHGEDGEPVTNVTPLDAVAALAADDKLVSAPHCVRCGFLPPVHGDLCCHCHTLTTMVRELLSHGLTVRDVAHRLGMHEKVVAPIAEQHAQ